MASVCGETVVLWPDHEGIVYTCSLPEGHDPGLPEEQRVHFSAEDSAIWSGFDADTVSWS